MDLRGALPLALALTAPLVSPGEAPGQPFPADVRSALDDAVELYRRVRAEQLVFATDPNERYEVVVGQLIFERADDDMLFNIGDEAFELEAGREGGLGSGEPWGPFPLPVRNRRLHDGERGGLDASSCRSCHFVGGPDGGGAPSQVALLRGDGRHLDAATVRDAPHVMGLGYIELAARRLERQINRRADIAREQAASIGMPVPAQLVADGVDFGEIIAQPDGTFDLAGLRGISPDLRLRPFGHKGRHRTLVALADEALQIHHGIQSDSRRQTRADDPSYWLGDGPPFDPDDDGVEREASAAQAVLLASYLSMLGVPRVGPPSDPVLAFAWSRGRALLESVGCTGCHRESLRLDGYETTHTARGDDPFSHTLDLSEAGQDPIPHRLDFTPDDEGFVDAAVPIFAFTDLRRHDLGPGLAEPAPEVLPDGGGEVPGAVWLTRSLWGLADTGPYLHDGRAPTVHDAIEWHGGEAAESRDAYRALPEADRAALRLFLMSLTRNPTLLVE